MRPQTILPPPSTDRESGIRFRRDSGIPPIVTDVSEVSTETLTPRFVALSMIVLFVGVALGAWTAAVTGVWEAGF